MRTLTAKFMNDNFTFKFANDMQEIFELAYEATRSGNSDCGFIIEKAYLRQVVGLKLKGFMVDVTARDGDDETRLIHLSW